MADQTATPWVDGLTIGQVLGETARRHANREAMVFPQLGRRWTWRQFAADVDAAARGLVGAWASSTGEHVAIWATNVPRVGPAAIRHRADRRGAGQHQPGLSAV